MTNEDRYNMLEASFKDSLSNENRKTAMPDVKKFRPLFKKMAKKLSEIPFDDCFVDAIVCRQRLDFELFCKDELHLSAAMLIDQTDDSVMCAVSHHKKNLFIGIVKNLDSFLNSATEAIKIVEEPK
jgi:hypothetical protein